MKKWYEKLFENYAGQYDNENFVRGTVGECNFIEKEINNNKQFRILDIACGTGRHSIELTKRGYVVTGVDLSEAQIKKAREKAKAENLQIEFRIHDARDLTFREDLIWL
jgi:2-polyprenyl-3-methyl-5-hydroxy-6-metoxy-1,4-benzoquinol methylase